MGPGCSLPDLARWHLWMLDCCWGPVGISIYQHPDKLKHIMNHVAAHSEWHKRSKGGSWGGAWLPNLSFESNWMICACGGSAFRAKGLVLLCLGQSGVVQCQLSIISTTLLFCHVALVPNHLALSRNQFKNIQGSE